MTGQRMFTKSELLVLAIFQVTFKLERILVEHIDKKYSLESTLQIMSICSVEIRCRTRDIYPVLMSQIFIVLSRLQETSLSPEGKNAIDETL